MCRFTQTQISVCPTKSFVHATYMVRQITVVCKTPVAFIYIFHCCLFIIYLFHNDLPPRGWPRLMPSLVSSTSRRRRDLGRSLLICPSSSSVPKGFRLALWCRSGLHSRRPGCSVELERKSQGSSYRTWPLEVSTRHSGGRNLGNCWK